MVTIILFIFKVCFYLWVPAFFWLFITILIGLKARGSSIFDIFWRERK